MSRYQRQCALPSIGIEGQRRLRAASVLVVGAGGLGCPLLQYLTAAGIGRLLLVDADVVEESNLHRQPLYCLDDVGVPKVLAATAALKRLNPDVALEPLCCWLRPDNANELVSRADIVVDAGDNRAVTYMLSDACQRQKKPLIAAQALGLEGHVGGFCGGGPSYRSLFPEMPVNAGNCSTGGILGSIVAIIGSLAGQFVLQYLLQITPSPLGRLIRFDAHCLRFRHVSFGSASEPSAPQLHFISSAALKKNDLVIDLRAPTEKPPIPFPAVRRLAVEQLDRVFEVEPEGRTVLCCQSGVRAWQAARRLTDHGWTNVALLAMAVESTPSAIN